MKNNKSVAPANFIGRVSHNGTILDDFITIDEPTEGWDYPAEGHPTFHSTPELFTLVGFDRTKPITVQPVQGSVGETEEDHQVSFSYRMEVYSRDDNTIAPDHIELHIPQDATGPGDLMIHVVGFDTNGIEGVVSFAVDYNKEVPPTAEDYKLDMPEPTCHYIGDHFGLVSEIDFVATSTYPVEEYDGFMLHSQSGEFAWQELPAEIHEGLSYTLAFSGDYSETGSRTHTITALIAKKGAFDEFDYDGVVDTISYQIYETTDKHLCRTVSKNNFVWRKVKDVLSKQI